MAVTILVTQAGDKDAEFILSVQNPVFWIFNVVSTSPLPDLTITYKFTIGTTTYEFNAINIDYDGSSGDFIFDGTNILNAILNSPDDIIPTNDFEIATEMFIEAEVEGLYNDNEGGGDIEFYNGSINIVNAARDVTEDAGMNDWYNGDSKLFYSQTGKETYWYFYNQNTSDIYLEYEKVSSTQVENYLTDNSELLIDNGEQLINTD
jgi:hypothetical protein